MKKEGEKRERRYLMDERSVRDLVAFYASVALTYWKSKRQPMV